jgi:hypothetical protein
MPKVTVVVPNYNHGRFLRARLDSVLGQTYRDFELLFLDDASTDDSLTVFAPYLQHPQVRAILNERNSGGVFRQWNRGVRAAHGEYVWLAESDDVAEPRFLETLLTLLERHPEVGLAYCRSWKIDESGRRLGLDDWAWALHPTRWDSDYRNSGPDECRLYLCRRNTIPNASGVVFRRDLFERVGYADEDMRLGGDWAMWVKMLLAADVAYVAEPLNLWRVPHADSVRQQTAHSLLCLEEHLRVLKLILAAGPLPPETLTLLAEDCVRGWQHHAHHDTLASEPLRHLALARAAAALGPDVAAAFLAAVMSHAVQSRRSLDELRRQLAELAQQVVALHEICGSLTLWARLQRVLMPRNGWRHRLGRSLLRLFRRSA